MAKGCGLFLTAQRYPRSPYLKVDRAKVLERLNDLVANYPNAEETRRSYLQNPDAMKQIESAALEEQVVDWVLERAHITDKPMSFKDLTGFGQTA